MLAEVMREDTYCTYRIRLELLLGISRDKSDQQIHDLIEAGFMPERVSSLIGLYLQIVSEPDQTRALKKMLRDRPCSTRPISAYESDKLFRLGHIAALPRWFSAMTPRLCDGFQSPRNGLQDGNHTNCFPPHLAPMRSNGC